ncbi:MAG: glycosyltransferase [Polyangiales bacterium]
MPERLSVIVPTYNEAANIEPLVRQLLAASDEREILVVDDSSPDGTADIVRRAFGDDPRVKLIVRTTDRGLANSIRTGLEASSGELLLVMDSDFNHDPAIIGTMRALLEHFDLVVGSRFVAGGGMEDTFRYYCSLVFNGVVRGFLGTRIQDNLSGFFAIRRSAFDQLVHDPIFFGYGDYFFRLLKQAADLRLRMVEIPVFYGLRTAGESKTKYFQVLYTYSKALVALVSSDGLKHRRLERSQLVVGDQARSTLAANQTDQQQRAVEQDERHQPVGRR